MVAINITDEAFSLLEDAKTKYGVNKKFIASQIIIDNLAKYLKKR